MHFSEILNILLILKQSQMKAIVSYFLISMFVMCYLVSCKNEQKDTIETVFFTQDSLYKITFDKPLEFDTFYAWEDIDDNSASHEYKYRFSKKSYPSQQETGFLWTSFADSTYRFTIMHNRNFYWKTLRDFNNDSSIVQLKNRLEYRTLIGEITIDSLEVKKIVINNQAYAISKYKQNENYKNGYWTYYLFAYTVVDSNFISFTADCRSQNCNGFIDRFEKTIKSIKIERFK
jgi:hypothetical protein